MGSGLSIFCVITLGGAKVMLKRMILLILIFLVGCQKPLEIVTTEGNSENMRELFFQAAESGNIEEIHNLLKQGIDINSKDTQGRTAIMIATYQNDAELVRRLIELGADIHIQDDLKNNPFLYAGAEGFLEIVKLTIESGADPKILNRYGGTALIPASEHGYVEVVREILETTQIDVNHVNNLGWTALMEAIVLNDGGKNQQETIKLLIQHGADVNIPDSEGKTPLERAEERGFSEIVDLLLKVGGK
jgi:uncharacterized protein